MILTVNDLINKLKEFPEDMPISINMAGETIEDVAIQTWVHSNYPYNKPDKDYVVIY